VQQEQKNAENWRLETDLSRRDMHGNGVLTSPFSQGRVDYFVKPQLVGVIHGITLTNGIELQSDNYHLNTLFSNTTDTQQEYSMFGLANFPVSSRVSFQAGLRGAQQNNQLSVLTTTHSLNRAIASTVGITAKITSAMEAYLRRAESYRFPKADENADAPPGVNGLKTQRGVSYETGIKFLYKKLASDFSLYQLNLRDEITFDPLQTPQNPFGVNTNFDRTVRRGFSVTEKLPVTHRVTIGGRYGYVNARFQQGIYAGNRIPLVAENIISANIDYAFKEHWQLYGEALYTGNEYADSDNTNIAGKMGGYTLYNGSVNYTYEHFTASLRVNNIFNKDYFIYTVYQPSLAAQFFYPAEGRNFSLNVKYEFA